MEEIKKTIQKNKWGIALIFIIIIIGIFFRTYNYSEWLHFETDQVDDVLITEPSVENGLGELKLLGPKAGAKFLRLPPGFYYLESLSANIFGNTPFAHALPVLLFSCLALPLFYLFSKIYFSPFISKLLLALFSFSIYLVIYSRFSWNPNLLPFFVLATLFALFKTITPEQKNRHWWFILLVGLFGFSSQLHYNALFILSAIIGTTLLIKRPRFSWKIWAIAFSLLAFLHLPLIIHEIKTEGFNTNLLLEKASDTTGDEKKKEGPLANLLQNFRYGAGEYFLIISGNDQINDGHLQGASWGLFCTTCTDNFLPRMAGYGFYLTGIFLLFFNLYREKNLGRKNFLLICALWFIFSFLYFWNLLNGKLYLYPRFFLIIAPLPFVFIGLMLEKIYRKKNTLLTALALSLVFIIALANIASIKSHFSSLASVSFEALELETEDVFPNTNRATLSLHKKVVERMAEQITDAKIPTYLLSESEYEPVYWYLLGKRGINFSKNLNDMLGDEEFFQEGYYFIIYQTVDLEKSGFIKKLSYFQIVSQEKFGSLTLFTLKPKSEWITGTVQDPNDREILPEVCQAERILDWKDIRQDTSSVLKKATRRCEK